MVWTWTLIISILIVHSALSCRCFGLHPKWAYPLILSFTWKASGADGPPATIARRSIMRLPTRSVLVISGVSSVQLYLDGSEQGSSALYIHLLCTQSTSFLMDHWNNPHSTLSSVKVMQYHQGIVSWGPLFPNWGYIIAYFWEPLKDHNLKRIILEVKLYSSIAESYHRERLEPQDLSLEISRCFAYHLGFNGIRTWTCLRFRHQSH